MANSGLHPAEVVWVHMGGWAYRILATDEDTTDNYLVERRMEHWPTKDPSQRLGAARTPELAMDILKLVITMEQACQIEEAVRGPG